MRTFYFSAASLALGLGFFCGCGGGGSFEQSYLPIGVTRLVRTNIEGQTIQHDAEGNAERDDEGNVIWNETKVPYVFGFSVTSAVNAQVIAPTSPAACTASMHVVNYVPGQDTAEQVSFYWSSNTGTQTTGLNAYVIMNNVANVTKGNGTATGSVRDAEFSETETQQDGLIFTLGPLQALENALTSSSTTNY